jgi:hypothetical protein
VAFRIGRSQRRLADTAQAMQRSDRNAAFVARQRRLDCGKRMIAPLEMP